MTPIIIPHGRPSDEWSKEQLAEYAMRQFARVDLINTRLGRATARQVGWAGKALILLRDKMKTDEQWTAWLNRHKRGTVNEAIRLAEYFKTVEELDGLTITEAKIGAGIVKVKKPSTAEAIAPLIKIQDVNGEGKQELRQMALEAVPRAAKAVGDFQNLEVKADVPLVEVGALAPPGDIRLWYPHLYPELAAKAANSRLLSRFTTIPMPPALAEPEPPENSIVQWVEEVMHKFDQLSVNPTQLTTLRNANRTFTAQALRQIQGFADKLAELISPKPKPAASTPADPEIGVIRTPALSRRMQAPKRQTDSIELLKQHPEGLLVSDIYEALGLEITLGHFDKQLKEMARDDLIRAVMRMETRPGRRKIEREFFYPPDLTLPNHQADRDEDED